MLVRITMAETNPNENKFSNCKVHNESSNKTTILKHMSQKKVTIGHVFKTCKEHNLREFNSIKDLISIARKVQKRANQS